MQARKHFYTKPQVCCGFSVRIIFPVRQARRAGEEHWRRTATRLTRINTFKLTGRQPGTLSHAALQTTASRKHCMKRWFGLIRNGKLTPLYCRKVLFATRESPFRPLKQHLPQCGKGFPVMQERLFRTAGRMAQTSTARVTVCHARHYKNTWFFRFSDTRISSSMGNALLRDLFLTFSRFCVK